ncbi:MBL fold metallo-hydrolase [Candidatus Bipolaricaulota bacterium]|nr:MBL fold metallo-hydrolase [Candidatus Bipolaricaulota bacterium]
MREPSPPDINLIPNGAFGQEDYGATYLIEGEEFALVDPGTSDSVPRLLDWFKENSLSPSRLSSILLTHIHLDHVGATGGLVDELSDLKVYVHDRGAPHLVDPSDLLASVKDVTGTRFSEYGTLKPIPEDRVVSLDERSTINLGSRELVALPTPGHAPHHVAYKDLATGAVFTGDSAGLYLGEELIPTTTPPSFDLEKSLASLRKIAKLSPSVLLYSHFGPGPEPIKLLDEYELILREWVELISDLNRSYEEEELVNEVLNRKRDWLGNGFTEEELAMNVRGVQRYLSWKGN